MANNPKIHDLISEIRLMLFLKTPFLFFFVPFMIDLGITERPYVDNQIKNHAIFTKNTEYFKLLIWHSHTKPVAG